MRLAEYSVCSPHEAGGVEAPHQAGEEMTSALLSLQGKLVAPLDETPLCPLCE